MISVCIIKLYRVMSSPKNYIVLNSTETKYIQMSIYIYIHTHTNIYIYIYYVQKIYWKTLRVQQSTIAIYTSFSCRWWFATLCVLVTLIFPQIHFIFRLSYLFTVNGDYCKLNWPYQSYRFSKVNVCLQVSSIHSNRYNEFTKSP